MGERMTPARVLAAAGLALVFLTSASVALAAGRVALVVGNSTYSHIARLPNPENDAADMAAALQRLGFDVTTAQDADRAALNEALRVFTRESVGADMALVFYAGHGLEMDGVNYLVPVDARLERDTDVRFETVALDDVLAATAGASLRMVILDACRNNPLARSMQRTVARRSVSGGSFGDLNEDLLGDETLVAYAAAAGTTAADGRGRNSPYTSALLAYLEEPLELSAVFRRVRGRVLESTDRQQRPHEYGSLLREHYLSGVSASAPVAVAAADGAAARLQQENLFWQSILGSRNAADRGVPRSVSRWRLPSIGGKSLGGAPAGRPGSQPAGRAGVGFSRLRGLSGDGGGAGGSFSDGLPLRTELQQQRALRARSVGGVVRAVAVRGDVRGVRPLRTGHGSPPAGRSRLGSWPPSRDRRLLGRCRGLRGMAVGGDGRTVSSAERGGVGVRGPGGNDNTVQLGP